MTAATTGSPVARSAARADHPGVVPGRRHLESASALVKGLLGDWHIGGVFQATWALPFDVTTTVDIAGVGPGSGGQYDNIVGDPEEGAHGIRRHTSRVVQQSGVPGASPRHLRDDLGAKQSCGNPASGTCTCRCARASAFGLASSGVALGRFQRAEPHDAGTGQARTRPVRISGRSPRAPGAARCRSGCSMPSDARIDRCLSVRQQYETSFQVLRSEDVSVDQLDRARRRCRAG